MGPVSAQKASLCEGAEMLVVARLCLLLAGGVFVLSMPGSGAGLGTTSPSTGFLEMALDVFPGSALLPYDAPLKVLKGVTRVWGPQFWGPDAIH